ncbi:Transposase [Shigella dysenteriae 1617]|uniref:Transposase n=1 Tax=Shigella dysenteriae 1617 TaxID=754093 RepID=A0A0A6ZU32_SHIDY|nr:Transposase [Shigella dysenteriae 1617]AHA66200.1 Transposase [Shigella dysenteriae 1617]
MVRTLKAMTDFAAVTATYTYEARKPGIKELITEMAFNGAGVRDTARTLKIGINTVIRTLTLMRPVSRALKS